MRRIGRLASVSCLWSWSKFNDGGASAEICRISQAKACKTVVSLSGRKHCVIKTRWNGVHLRIISAGNSLSHSGDFAQWLHLVVFLRSSSLTSAPSCVLMLEKAAIRSCPAQQGRSSGRPSHTPSFVGVRPANSSHSPV